MGKRNGAAKTALLKKILEKKAILFAAFSDKITRKSKINKWKQVAELTKSFHIPIEKDFMYVRDTLWPNIRNLTTKKIDNARKTGTGGGAEAKFTAIDHVVIDILGKDSPGVMGLGINDSFGKGNEMDNIISVAVDNEVFNVISGPVDENPRTTASSHQLQCDITDDNSTCNYELPGKQSVVKICHKNSKRHKEIEEEDVLKKRKLELQIEQLELQNYKLKLEILEKEKSLNVFRSKYTAELEQNDF